MRPIRSSTSAPRCAPRMVRSMAAATSRMRPTRRALAPRPVRSRPWSRPAANASSNAWSSGGSAPMVAAGGKRILECLVVGPGPEVITPCGGCRQKLREFATDDLPIHLCGPDGLHRTVPLGQLFPMSFGPPHPRRPRRPASPRDPGPALPDVLRPAPSGEAMIEAITAKAPGFKPKVAVILGSGLGAFAEEVKPVATIPYGELPGF